MIVANDSMTAELAIRLRAAFLEGLDLPSDAQVSELRFMDHPHWDSLGHMTLLDTIEAHFGFVLEGEDVLRMNSFPGALVVLTEALENKGSAPR